MSSPAELSAADLWCATGEWAELRAKLPRWARFMARCGQRLAGSRGPGLTVGVTVPARGYAAALAAAGVTLARDALEPMAPGDVELHLASLRETPAHTPIKYHAKDQIYDGRWLGIAEVGEAEMLSFETRKMIRKLPLRAALSIRLTGEVSSSGQLWAKRISTPPLLKAFTGESAALTFVTTARADCLLVGTQTLLEEELTSETFYANGSVGEETGGHLQDIVRARDLAGARRYFRAIIVPSSAGPTSEVREMHPHVVIFDGGRAYLRWRHLWPDARQLVIIDRSVSNAEEAAGELSMAFAERKADSGLLRKLKGPPGIEAISFERHA